MYFNDLLTRIVYLTKRNNITNSEIGKAIKLDRQAMSGRALRNTNFKDEEIAKIEEYFGINLANVSITENSFKLQNDASIEEKAEAFSSRLIELQTKNNLTDKAIADIIGINEEEYIEYKTGDRKPNFRMLLALRQHFQISFEWIILGV